MRVCGLSTGRLSLSGAGLCDRDGFQMSTEEHSGRAPFTMVSSEEVHKYSRPPQRKHISSLINSITTSSLSYISFFSLLFYQLLHSSTSFFTNQNAGQLLPPRRPGGHPRPQPGLHHRPDTPMGLQLQRPCRQATPDRRRGGRQHPRHPRKHWIGQLRR